MKILFVHEVDYQEKVIFEMHEFPEMLAERGHDVSFVDFPEHERLWPPRLRMKREKIKGRVISNSEIKLIRLARVFPFPIDRLYNACVSWFQIRAEIRKSRPDLIFLYGVPTNGWQTVLLARRDGIPVIYRAIDVSHQIRNTLFSRLIKVAEKFVVRNVDLVLTNNLAMSEHVTSLGAPVENVRVLFPGVAGIGTEREVEEFEKRSDVILFMGTLFEFSGLTDLLGWINEWQGLAGECELWILGDGPHKKSIVEKANELGCLGQIKFFGFVPFHELDEMMRTATVAVLPFNEIPVAHIALPGKVPQYIRAGLPVVSTRLRGLSSLLSEGEGVLYATPGKEFVAKINQLLNDVDLQHAVVKRGTVRLNETCNWAVVIREIESIITDLGSKIDGHRAS